MEVKFLEALRSKTHSVHKLLEQTLISRAIVSPEVTLDVYKAYLQKVWCLHAPVEKTVHPLLAPYIHDLAGRQKSEKILLDLHSLNTEPDTCSISFLDADFIPSISFCFGIMYVIEGSTLGGMHILRNVTTSIKDENLPTHFFNAYGQYTGSKWKLFLEILNNYENAVNAEQAAEIIEGAIYGFNQTYKIFNA